MGVMNVAVVTALVFLTFGVIALLAAVWTLIPQITRTLGAYEKLADTLETELGPTLKEVQKVVSGVGELKQIAGQRVQDVSTRVEDVTGNLTKAAGSATKHTSAIGAGLWAGVRAYLDGNKGHHEHDINRGGLEKITAEAGKSET